MILSEQDIKEFQELWRREFGEEITPEDAHREAHRLLILARILLPPPRRQPQPNVSNEQQ
jgi:hypothetical protein